MTIFDVFRQNVVVTRKTGGSVVDYIWNEGSPVTFIILASIQPTPAEVMETLPEGHRTKSAYTLYTETELFTSSRTGDPDMVTLGIDRYLVTKVERWQNHLIDHFEIVVVKEDKDAS